MREISPIHGTLIPRETIETAAPPSGPSGMWPHFPRSDDGSVGVDQRTYDNLVRYTKYASGAYQILCPRPMGNTLVVQFQDLITSTKGFIARDDKREEIVIAFRGTTDTTCILLDLSIILVPLQGPGMPPLDSLITSSAEEPHLHGGFLLAYNSVAGTLLAQLEAQLHTYPTYNVVLCGHSLGVNRIVASARFGQTFEPLPNRDLLQASPRLLSAIRFLGGAFAYTLSARHFRSARSWLATQVESAGQPRTGDRPFAELVERTIGTDNIYRCVHLIDGVPTMIPTQLGYRHFGAEYWQFSELGAPKNVKRFEGGEDPNGSGNIPSTGANPAHWFYFRHPIASDPTVCI